MTSFAHAIEGQAPARLRVLLAEELRRGDRELQERRSGYGEPVSVAFGDGIAAVPALARARADASAMTERAWLVVAAAVEALVQSGGEGPLGAGVVGEWLGLRTQRPGDGELAVVAFDEAIAGVDRLRAQGVVVPELTGEDWRDPIGSHHPLKVAHAVATLGGRPSDPASVNEHEDAVLEILGANAADVPRPHDDPDPGRRIARRILQRLDGMGKWGGYHTEFAHLARGFAPADQQQASAIGEALLQAGLLAEKPSVGQRHVFLDPRRVKEIRGLIERGEVPAGLALPEK